MAAWGKIGVGWSTAKKKSKKQSVSQTIDLVVAIKTHTESSKSELSSESRRPVKVWELRSENKFDVKLYFKELPCLEDLA